VRARCFARLAPEDVAVYLAVNPPSKTSKLSSFEVDVDRLQFLDLESGDAIWG